MFSFGSIDHIRYCSKLYYFHVDSSNTLNTNVSGLTSASISDGKFSITFPELPDTNFGIVATPEPDTYVAKKIWTRADVLSTTKCGFMIESLDGTQDATGISGLVFSMTPYNARIDRTNQFSFADDTSEKLSGIYRIVNGKCGSSGNLNGINFDDITSENISTGIYRISGSFQSSNYAVIVGVKQNGTNRRFVTVPSARKSSSSFDIYTYNASGNLSSRSFAFTIVEWS